VKKKKIYIYIYSNISLFSIIWRKYFHPAGNYPVLSLREILTIVPSLLRADCWPWNYGVCLQMLSVAMWPHLSVVLTLINAFEYAPRSQWLEHSPSDRWDFLFWSFGLSTLALSGVSEHQWQKSVPHLKLLWHFNRSSDTLAWKDIKRWK
jgi:hypothetical protein